MVSLQKGKEVESVSPFWVSGALGSLPQLFLSQNTLPTDTQDLGEPLPTIYLGRLQINILSVEQGRIIPPLSAYLHSYINS